MKTIHYNLYELRHKIISDPFLYQNADKAIAALEAWYEGLYSENQTVERLQALGLIDK